MVKLSVNVNKIATLRNSRGGAFPRVLDAVRVCVEAGVPGITVHPRADRRHITPTDVRDIATALAAGAEVLYSEDMHHEQMIDSTLKIRSPFRVRAEQARGAYRVRRTRRPVRRR